MKRIAAIAALCAAALAGCSSGSSGSDYYTSDFLAGKEGTSAADTAVTEQATEGSTEEVSAAETAASAETAPSTDTEVSGTSVTTEPVTTAAAGEETAQPAATEAAEKELSGDMAGNYDKLRAEVLEKHGVTLPVPEPAYIGTSSLTLAADPDHVSESKTVYDSHGTVIGFVDNGELRYSVFPEYDAKGSLVKRTVVDGEYIGELTVETFEYNDEGVLTNRTYDDYLVPDEGTPASYSYEYTLNDHGDVVEEKFIGSDDPIVTNYTYVYDNSGNPVVINRSSGGESKNVTLREYDENGNMVGESVGLGSDGMIYTYTSRAAYTYDEAGNMLTETSYRYVDGVVSGYTVRQYSYDSQGRVLISTDSSGASYTYTYEDIAE